MGTLLYIIAAVLVVAWLVGLTAFHIGGLIHILLVVAVIVFVFRLIAGRSL